MVSASPRGVSLALAALVGVLPVAASSCAHADMIARPRSPFAALEFVVGRGAPVSGSYLSLTERRSPSSPSFDSSSSRSRSSLPSRYSRIMPSAHSTALAAGTEVRGLTRAESARWEREGRRCPGSLSMPPSLALPPLSWLAKWTAYFLRVASAINARRTTTSGPPAFPDPPTPPLPGAPPASTLSPPLAWRAFLGDIRGDSPLAGDVAPPPLLGLPVVLGGGEQ
mmetsp:Transcript_46849/g.99478  ORF Transcript_46849/g.99478 Transcript_46849/m.99478 type:complete len:225 (-) Transcript_46849:34-708(-)